MYVMCDSYDISHLVSVAVMTAKSPHHSQLSHLKKLKAKKQLKEIFTPWIATSSTTNHTKLYVLHFFLYLELKKNLFNLFIKLIIRWKEKMDLKKYALPRDGRGWIWIFILLFINQSVSEERSKVYVKHCALQYTNKQSRWLWNTHLSL